MAKKRLGNGSKSRTATGRRMRSRDLEHEGSGKRLNPQAILTTLKLNG
jgi:hypothetical protein